MLLPWLILIPFIGGFLCWQTERFGVKVPRWIALITMGLTLALSLQLWLQGGYSLTQSTGILTAKAMKKPSINRYSTPLDIGVFSSSS